jgi:hypothetical protein
VVEVAVKEWFFPGAVVAAVFVLTRLPALQLQLHDSDINLYARYAAEWYAAPARGQSFYDLHRQRVDEEIARATPGQAAALREYKNVEYPPLAVCLMAVPAALVDDPFEGEFPTGLPPRYARAFVGVFALLDLAVFLLVVLLVCRLFPAESPFEKCERCLVYVLGSWLLYGVIYARLDLGVALAVIGALALLVSRGPWWLSFLVLALGVHFKLMPIVVAPLWLIAALPASCLRESWLAIVRGLLIRAGVLAGFGFGMLAVFWSWQGSGILEFLAYHKDRGLEIESVWSSLLLLLEPIAGHWNVYHSHGSVNVRSPLTPLLATVASLTMVLTLLAATGLFVVAARRQLPTKRATIAQTHPRLVAGFTALLMLLSIVTNKVFSPQYLLWVLPLIPLLDLRRSARRLYFLGTLAMVYLTMRIFPDCFVGDIVWSIGRNEDMPIFDGPSAYGAFLLLTRNALSLILTGSLAWILVRRAVGGEAHCLQQPTYLPSPAAPPTIRTVA